MAFAARMDEFTARVDHYGKGAWIALTVLSFWLAWPIGLAMLFFIVFSGRMRGCSSAGRWHNERPRGFGSWGHPPSSGNQAFDAYRAETLKRLEEEQREFVDYLERLRKARDKEEFDRFMAERRNRPDATVQA